MGYNNDRREARRDPIVKEYAKQASIYDRKWAFYINATLRETMARLRIDRGSKLLDVRCGTGQLLEAMADRYPESTLTGVDPVAEMLAVARRRLPSHVSLYEAWAEALPFKAHSKSN